MSRFVFTVAAFHSGVLFWQIRDHALATVLELHESSGTLARVIEDHAVERLKNLTKETPPAELADGEQR